ncbi:sulfotransferase [Thioclava sp. GXIMD4215]|uniref:sulfotransferase n=1 Tax=Thioclava sp. GXIMD4215 TaxID=3131928 RepID=UPI0032445B45
MEPKLIICGMEHTGTTLVSDLFRQVPGLDSGFECGVLLRETPKEFLSLQPFSQNMLKGWGLTPEELETMCRCESHSEFYEKLIHFSRTLPEGTSQIFDKTPRYLSELSSVLKRVSSPVIVTYKDPRAIVCSDFKRAKTENFDAWYSDYLPKKKPYLINCYSEFKKHSASKRTFYVGLENLAMNARALMEGMFDHAGEKFKIDYAIIKELRYVNTKNNTVSADIAFEYLRVLKSEWQKKIETDFHEASDWFYA